MTIKPSCSLTCNIAHSAQSKISDGEHIHVVLHYILYYYTAFPSLGVVCLTQSEQKDSQ